MIVCRIEVMFAALAELVIGIAVVEGVSSIPGRSARTVTGLRTWNSLGRFVKRGEKGIFILAPMIGKKRNENEAAREEDKKSDGEARLYGFRAVYVFDVSQTEGKDLPALTEVNGDVSGYRERLFKFVESQRVELSFSEKIAPAKGLSHGGKITLLSGMQPAEEFSTLVHEIAHEMLHRGERRTLTTKQVRETEADFRTEPHLRTTYSFGMETPICCARAWKPFN